MEWCTEARGSGRGTTDVGKRAQVADLLSRCLGYPKAFLPSPAERAKGDSAGSRCIAAGAPAASALLAAQSWSELRDGCRPAIEICGSPDRATTSGVARPAFVRTRYSGLIDSGDPPVDAVLSLAGGEEEGPRVFG
jgi:hypothetical protein